MGSYSFDTLKISQNLRDIGKFTPEQAEAISASLALATGGLSEGLSTKSELSEIRTSMKSDITSVLSEISSLKSEIKSNNSELKAELLKWMFGNSLAIVGLIAGLILAVLKFAK